MWRNIIYYHCFWCLTMSAEQGILPDAIGIMLLLISSGVLNPLVHGPAPIHGWPGTGPCKQVESPPCTYGTTKLPPHLVCRKTALHWIGLQHPKGWHRTNWVNKQNGEKVPSLPKPSSDCLLKLLSLVFAHLRIPDHTKDKKPCIPLFSIGNIGMLYCWCLFHFWGCSNA